LKIKSEISILLMATSVPTLGFVSVSNIQTAYSQYDYEKYLIVPDKVSDGDKDKKKSQGQLVVTQRSAPFMTRGSVDNDVLVSTALCNADEVVVGGGYEFNVESSIGTTGNEHPVIEKATGNGWSVFVNVPGTWKAYAECAKLSP
jgi:hypothetical protein